MHTKKLFTLAFLGLALSGVANAATFETTKTVKSVSGSKLLRLWRAAIESSEDAGAIAAVITEKKTSQSWVNVVKQYLHKNYAETVSADRISISGLKGEKELNYLVSQNYYLEEHLKENPNLREALVEALEGLNGNKLIFAGELGGNTFSYNHLTVVDVTRSEIFTLYAGTSD